MLDRLKAYRRWALDLLLMPLAILMPRNPKKIIFGAWDGKAFQCNPKYLMLYFAKRGGCECYWFGEELLRKEVEAIDGVRFVRKGSLLSYYHALTAGFYASNVNWKDDVLWVPTCGKVTILYTSHGYPDKRMGERQFGGNGAVEKKVCGSYLRIRLRKLLERLERFLYPNEAWSSASSPQGDELRVLNMPWRLSMDRMLHAGTPRADYVIANAKNDELKQQLRKKIADVLDIPLNRRWIIFVPTWRHDPKYLYSFTTSTMSAKWQDFFAKNGIILIEKQHPKTLAAGFVSGGNNGSICVVGPTEASQIDTQELLLASDVLITDYSSIYYDFYLMNRPCVHFVYDWDHAYNKDFGFDFDLREYGGGPFVYEEEELFKYLAMPSEELLKLRNEKTREQLSYETGHCCEAYYNLFQRMSRNRGFFAQ